ncbi:MAG: hypothetical protein ACK52I_22200 [Pseudomonadota bacterium]|jgi:hypothetical protein
MKTSKFLIAENPVVNDGRIFIIHMREPVIIAEAFHFDIDKEHEWMECKKNYSVGASVDYPGELIFLGANYIEPLPSKWLDDPQKCADVLAKIMSRMGDWYYNYLKFEDGNADTLN